MCFHGKLTGGSRITSRRFAACFTDLGFCVVSQRIVSIKFKFSWDMYLKHSTTMLIGTSPELEIALYTLCFRARPNTTCSVSYYGKEFTILTKVSPDSELRSAYFARFP